MPLQDKDGRMPKKVSGSPVESGGLNVGQGSDNGLGQMPRRNNEARQTQPRRK
jgi:hypothetical protein